MKVSCRDIPRLISPFPRIFSSAVEFWWHFYVSPEFPFEVSSLVEPKRIHLSVCVYWKVSKSCELCRSLNVIATGFTFERFVFVTSCISIVSHFILPSNLLLCWQHCFSTVKLEQSNVISFMLDENVSNERQDPDSFILNLSLCVLIWNFLEVWIFKSRPAWIIYTSIHSDYL